MQNNNKLKYWHCIFISSDLKFLRVYWRMILYLDWEPPTTPVVHCVAVISIWRWNLEKVREKKKKYCVERNRTSVPKLQFVPVKACRYVWYAWVDAPDFVSEHFNSHIFICSGLQHLTDCRHLILMELTFHECLSVTSHYKLYIYIHQWIILTSSRSLLKMTTVSCWTCNNGGLIGNVMLPQNLAELIDDSKQSKKVRLRKGWIKLTNKLFKQLLGFLVWHNWRW